MWKSDLFSFRLSKKYNLDIESNDPKLSHINGGDVVREDFQSNHFQKKGNTGNEISVIGAATGAARMVVAGELQSNLVEASLKLKIRDQNSCDWILIWENLCYTLNHFHWDISLDGICRRNHKKEILTNLSGSLRTGTLMAIIGPSGAGKSTFLECLAGRRKKNLTGKVFLNPIASPSLYDTGYLITPKIAFIAQVNHLIGFLTVRESLEFATKLKNYKLLKAASKFDPRPTRPGDLHNFLVNKILKDLQLIECSDVLVCKCSGGEAKRLSFALELISSPDILILDEPTSGLDSSSALKCIRNLRSLTEMGHQFKTPAIISSIHQPSSSVLNLFHQVYVLSRDGQCIYSGSTDHLVSYFNDCGLRCPVYSNPSDYIIEISAGDHGKEWIRKLASKVRLKKLSERTDPQSSNYISVIDAVTEGTQQSHPFFRHLYLLFRRTWKSTIREPMLSWLRFSQFFILALIVSFTYNYKIGEYDCCFIDLLESAKPGSSAEYAQDLARRGDNGATLFFILMFFIFSSMMPTVLTFPFEMSVFVKERSNGWYSCFSYYIAKVLADMPFQIAFPFMFCCIFYPMTGQILVWWRFAWFCIISLLVSTIAQSIGMIMGTIFLDDPFAAVFMSTVSCCPLFLVGGFLLRGSVINWVLKPIWYLSFIRYAFGALLTTLYGFGRCKPLQTVQPQSALTIINDFIGKDEAACLFEVYQENGTCVNDILDECNLNIPSLIKKGASKFGAKEIENIAAEIYETYDGSYILSYFEVSSKDFVFNIIILILFIFILRLINYWILLYKISKKTND